MKPLSVLYYCLKNRKRVLSMAISIGFSIALIFSLSFLLDEIKHSDEYTTLNPLESYSEVWPSTEKPITKDVINMIINDKNTDKVIPRISQKTFYYRIAGRNNVSLFSLNHEDMQFFLKRLRLKLVKGRLPTEDTTEIAMDYHVAKNKGLKLGDKIGYDVDKKEGNISGTHTIVGFIDGDCMVMVTPIQKEIDGSRLLPSGILVFPKEGKMEQYNEFLEGLPKQTVGVWTYQRAAKAVEKDSKDLKKYMNILVVMLIIVLSLSTGNASYINIIQRRYEFGLLNSVGYTNMQILKKASMEIFIMNLTGYIAGVVLTLVFAAVEYIFVFEPNGLILRLVLPDAILQTLAILVFSSLFSIIPVSRMLQKIDPISIIEGVA